MNWKWKTALVGALMIGVGATGCVEEEASVILRGNVIGEAEIDEAEEEDGNDENGNETSESDDDEAQIFCQIPTEFEEPTLRSTGFVNLGQMDTHGQRLLRGDDDTSRPNTYDFGAVFENRLEDSRSVGAVSGGEGSGFEGLALDRNDVMIKSVTVSFDHDINVFSLEGGTVSYGFERERLVNMLVTSGGGVASFSVPIMNNSGEVQEFREFVQGVNSNVPDRGDDDPLTLVARIQLHGETLAGNQVESNSLEFPIDVCVDCGESETDALCREGG